MLTGAAPVLVVKDIAASLAHYRDTLGFDVTFQFGEPIYYVCLCRDDVNLHLLAAHRTRRLPGHGGVAVFVRDVDALHAEFSRRGAKTLTPPQDTSYGMREFNAVDSDGNQLTFGMAAGSA